MTGCLTVLLAVAVAALLILDGKWWAAILVVAALALTDWDSLLQEKDRRRKH